jgi:hypothetical protein
MECAGWPLSSEGIVTAYKNLISGLVADQPTGGPPVLETDVLMDSAAARRRLADETLRFALALG